MNGDGMAPSSFTNIAVLARSGAEPQRYARALRKAIRASLILRLEKPDAADIIVLIGGDGFLLSSIRKYGYLKKPFLGINFGDVGFFMNAMISPYDLLKTLTDPQRYCTAQPYPLLDIAFTIHNSGARGHTIAFNETVLERMKGQSLHLDITIDGVGLNRFAGDAVMVSTPQGTTGYAINTGVGAPAMHPAVPAMILVPVNPQKSYRYRSLLFPVGLPLSSSVTMHNVSPKKRPAQLVCDGRRYGNVESATVRGASETVIVLRYGDASYAQTLVDKIIGPPQEDA